MLSFKDHWSPQIVHYFLEVCKIFLIFFKILSITKQGRYRHFHVKRKKLSLLWVNRLSESDCLFVSLIVYFKISLRLMVYSAENVLSCWDANYWFHFQVLSVVITFTCLLLPPELNLLPVVALPHLDDELVWCPIHFKFGLSPCRSALQYVKSPSLLK